MKTTALRLYGKRDLRLETFDLPEMQEDEILATVVTDSLCLSSWKEANLGENHKKVPDDVATNPIIIGHEFCGDILAVGKKWQHKFQPGQRYVIQANLQLPFRPYHVLAEPRPQPVAVYFCCTGLRVTPTGRYPASCPMKPGLSSPAVFRHLQPRSPVLHIYLIYQAFFQKSSPFTNFNKRNIKCFLKDDRSIDGFYLQYYLNKCKERFKTSNS